MNKTVLITGISSGIGYHLARTYTEKGYQVFGSIRSEADKLRLSKELPDLHLLMFDITDNDAIKRAIKELEAQLQGNGLDILINNAGMVVSGPLMLLEIDEFKRQYDINVFGLLRVTQACLPLLGAVENPNHKPGMIINISSVTGQIAFPFAGAYSSSKFAIEGLSHSLRRELLPFGIRVVIIGPASVKTPIWEKDSTTSIPEKTKNSIFGKYVTNFQKLMLKTAKDSLYPVQLARDIVKVSEKNQPKVRYAFAQKYLLEWLLPRYIFSHRVLDKVLMKAMNKG